MLFIPTAFIETWKRRAYLAQLQGIQDPPERTFACFATSSSLLCRATAVGPPCGACPTIARSSPVLQYSEVTMILENISRADRTAGQDTAASVLTHLALDRPNGAMVASYPEFSHDRSSGDTTRCSSSTTQAGMVTFWTRPLLHRPSVPMGPPSFSRAAALGPPSS